MMINNILKVTVVGLLVSVGMMSSSHAQFEMNSAEESIEVSSIPFVVALRKIVPIDYDFSFGTEENLGQLVSYQIMDDWTDTLSSMLSEIDLSYKIEDSVIYIYPIQEEVAPVVQEVVAAPAPVVEEVVEAPVVVEVVEAPVAPVVVSQPVWQVKKGYTLQETVKQWGEKANWTVVWDSERDFNIQSEVSFKGSFVEAATELINAFAKADPPVVGTFYKNNTLVIETTSNGEVN